MRFLATPPDPQIARPQDRSRDPQHSTRSPMVPSTIAACWPRTWISPGEYPVATKRVSVAEPTLKAVDLCVSDPQAARGRSADKGFRQLWLRLRPAYALRSALRRMEEFDPEDTLRFYALRMRNSE